MKYRKLESFTRYIVYDRDKDCWYDVWDVFYLEIEKKGRWFLWSGHGESRELVVNYLHGDLYQTTPNTVAEVDDQDLKFVE